MLFLSALVSLLPLTALATPIATQPANVKAVADYPTISKVLNDIITQCKKLVATSARFTGDAVDAVPILDDSGTLLKMLKDGQAKVSGTETIGLKDSIEVLYPVYNLNTAVDGVVKSLMDKKPMFDKVGVTLVVADRLEDEKTAAQALITAVVSKLPAYLPGVIGTTAAQPIMDKLEKATNAFKPADSATPASPAAPLST
ncbi:hypothetical protein Vi05172_g12627 [Venturia inaequalis]|uniref:Cell wall protein n=1 Tax=Venturia inaequalis TaxID=5025 RepID=A0A8H3YU44_VENIN|nr:hypothetical protein EG327_009025 [Venturia inaequalis]RDI77421.1 hypothetical protein Vi05172_g12627 [Venturia inaequalis]